MSNFLLLFFSLLAFITFAAKHCDGRGGCDCNCSWATTSNCLHDDGTCCWGCCCGSTPTPPTPGTLSVYCPSANDLIGFGNPQIYDQGWTLTGAGAVGTKTTFNLLGGSVEFDFDVTNARKGVNSNIYTISPTGVSSSGYVSSNYCDGSKPAGNDWCVEVDWIESNGNCGGQSTLHDIPGTGNNGCTAWGCASSYHYNGRTSFHMKITYDNNGVWTTYRDGQEIAPNNLHPTPSGKDWATVKQYYEERGALIYSSQWVGWVPLDDCGTTGGDVSKSTYSVRNLRITGIVKQGPTPRLCGGFLP